ncbi:hypothetical protein WJX72_007622 [[Myrmecia] bisecta]|uniref:Uncharacterized protein n=1 Tax=[Myrmecia] bisecta TaxID=41462 RepID=A0AAW1PSQ3_9CHLO
MFCGSSSCAISLLPSRGRLVQRRASSDQEDEGPTFAQIDPDSEGGVGGTSEEVFGPAAVALIGFQQDEVDTFRQAMTDMEADFVKIVSCGRRQLEGSLQEALEGPAPLYEQPPLGVRRAVILSGMYSAEVLEVIGAYKDTGLTPPVWAAAVPANYTRRLADLVDDIYGDHQRMVLKEREDLQAVLLRQQDGQPAP